MRVCSEDLAWRHYRLIAKVCCGFWISLPDHVKAYTDMEDLIADAACVVAINAHKYDRKKGGAESTFVHQTTYFYCGAILQRHKQKCRAATAVVELEEWNGSAHSHTIRWVEARRGVERILQFASENLRRMLTEFLERRTEYDRHISRCVPEASMVEELRRLVRQHAVSWDDLAEALKVL